MKIKKYIIGIIIVILDQLSKILIINKNITIIHSLLSFTYTKNYGGAFSIEKFQVITILSIAIIIGIIAFLLIKKEEIKNYTPYILILSGSIGNLIDRLARGYVIDFININLFNFPSFNIADTCIVLGIVWLIVFILKGELKNSY